MSEIGVGIVDDEPRARSVIRHLLARDDEVEVLGESYGDQAPMRIAQLEPDLLFLDVQMPRLDGFGVLSALAPERLPLVVFTTAYDEYALQAFEHCALDYLLKPFSDRRFFRSLARAKDILRRREADVAQRRLLALLAHQLNRLDEDAAALPRTDPPAGSADRIILQDGNRTIVLLSPDILWIEAEGPYVRVDTMKGDRLVRESLGRIEERLDPQCFCRVHRSVMVNMDSVEEVRPLSHGDSTLILRGGNELKLSRTRREEFESRLRR